MEEHRLPPGFGPPHALVCSRHPLDSAVGPECIDPLTNFRIGSEGKLIDEADRTPDPSNPFIDIG